MTLTQIVPPPTAPHPDAPTPWRQIADKPAGGFVKCSTDWLLLPWGLYRAGQLDFLGLRTWCGLLELPERRCDRPPDQDVHYSIEELAHLLDVPRRAPVQTAVRRLEDLGLVAWSMSAIAYLPTPAALHHRALPGYQALQAQLHPWRTWVPVPRRLVRWLAREGNPGLWATAAGVLLRCLWSKQRHCVSGGRVAAAWIAEGFGLAKRTVYRRLDGLQECGWLERFANLDAADAAMAQRHGARTVVNLQWNVPGASEPEDTDEAPASKKARKGKPRPACQEVSVEHFVKHSTTLDQNLSPLSHDCDQNLSPLPCETLPETPRKYSGYTTPSRRDFYPLQEQRPDPLPALRVSEMPTRACENPPTGVCQKTPEENKHPSTQVAETPAVTPPSTPTASTSPAPLEDATVAFAALPSAEQDALFQAATARLVAHGLPAAFLIRPVVLAEIYTHLAAPSQATTPAEAPRATPDVALVNAPVSTPPRPKPRAQVAASGRPAALVAPTTVPACVEHFVKHTMALNQKLSPRPSVCDQKLSPLQRQNTPETPEKITSYPPPSGRDFSPLQEQRQKPDPLSTLHAPERPTAVCATLQTGVEQKTPEENLPRSIQVVETSVATPLPPPPASLPPTLLADPAAVFAALPSPEQDALLAEVMARLLAQGVRKELLIRPLLLAEVYAQLTPSSPATLSSACRETSPSAHPPHAGAPAHPQALGAGAPPDLRDVVPADLRDGARLEALRQQAIRRGWLTGCDADRLNFVAAAMHARRIGAKPCALFVAVVREKRWELITQEDEDQARALLRERDAGPSRQAAAPMPGLSEDARFVRGVQQLLRQAGWRDDPFLAIVQRYPGWTRTRWDTALAELHAPGARQALKRLGEMLRTEDCIDTGEHGDAGGNSVFKVSHWFDQ